MSPDPLRRRLDEAQWTSPIAFTMGAVAFGLVDVGAPRAFFEVLLPHIRPGGRHAIQDWRRARAPGFRDRADQPPLHAALTS